MEIKTITERESYAFDTVVSHPLQTYEWGKFREKTGVKVIRRGFFKNGKLISGFQLTIHKIPHTLFTIGYLPKGDMPTEEMLKELIQIGKQEKCIFIQLEPNIRKSQIQNFKSQINLKIQNTKYKIQESAHPLFTKYTFVLDLTKSEEELLKNMHPKARYNIKVAQKHGVAVVEDNSNEAFAAYLQLTKETTTRQKFYAHTPTYHKLMWETLQGKSVKGKGESFDKLSAHLLVAYYKPSPLTLHPLPLTTWILFVFKDTLYYPYGASSSEFRNVMHSNLIMWEVIRFGKNLGLKKFDMWGALGPDPDKNDPWYGFHNFKEKYGPEHVEFIGSYDLIINPILYQGYKLADKLRWLLLRIKK